MGRIPSQSLFFHQRKISETQRVEMTTFGAAGNKKLFKMQEGYLYTSEYFFSNIKVVYGNEGFKEININIQTSACSVPEQLHCSHRSKKEAGCVFSIQ